MSRRSNPLKQKSKAKSALSSNESPGLAIVKPAESISVQKEMLSASLLEAINSVRTVGEVFSDEFSVNNAILESASVTESSLSGSISMATVSNVAVEAPVSCTTADAMATAVLERIDADMDSDTDFGANIFVDEEPVLSQLSCQAERSVTVLQELKVSESQVGEESCPEDCCLEESSCVEEVAVQQVEVVDSDDLVSDRLVGGANAIYEFEADPENLNASSFCSSPVSAIDAAVEILSQAVDEDEVTRCALRSSDKPIENTQHAMAVPVDSSVGSLRSELKELTETLRTEFRQSLEALQASQSAANAAQSEVLKTLTEIMFQSAGSRDIPVDAIEKAFSGVEERLMARLDAVAGNADSATNSSTAGSPGPIATRTGHGSPMKLQNAASSVTRSWEQIKTEMMTKGELTETSSKVNPQKPAKALPEVAQLTSDRHFRLPEQDLSLEIPKALDPETVSDQELRDAFREREAFIATLIARIRRQQESATGQLSAEQLRVLAEELPDELAEQVRHTLKQMDDLARMGELELSLERARIARQVSQLALSRQLLERNARQMGMIVNADGTIVHGPNQADVEGADLVAGSENWALGSSEGCRFPAVCFATECVATIIEPGEFGSMTLFPANHLQEPAMRNLDRRIFLQASLATGLAGVVQNVPVLANSAAAESKMRFGLVTYLWGKDMDLPTLIASCEKSGLGGVEVRTEHKHGVEPSLSKAQRQEVRKRFEDSPVELVGYGSNAQFHEAEPEKLKANIELTKQYIQLMHDCGGSGVKVKPNSFVKGVEHEKTIEQIGEALNEVAAYGQQYGQQIRVEVHGPGTSELPVIKSIFDVADHPNVAVCWNSNGEDLKGEGLEYNFNLVKSRFGKTVHVRELNMDDYPYQQLISLFHANNYDGWILLEARTEPADKVVALTEQRLVFEQMVQKAQS